MLYIPGHLVFCFKFGLMQTSVLLFFILISATVDCASLSSNAFGDADGSNMKCYFFDYTQNKWETGRSYCKSQTHGGYAWDLVSPQTLAEETYLKGKMMDKT